MAINRPTFDYNNKPVRAAGVIFYYEDPLTNNKKMLLQYAEKLKDNIKVEKYYNKRHPKCPLVEVKKISK